MNTIELIRMSEPDLKKIINLNFKINNVNHKIFEIKKSWGKIPCFLANVSAIDDNSRRHKFIIVCKLNPRAENSNEKWIVTLKK